MEEEKGTNEKYQNGDNNNKSNSTNTPPPSRYVMETGGHDYAN
jgi:hypothetical protein